MRVLCRVGVHVTGAVAVIVLSACVLPASAQTLAERVEANGGKPVTVLTLPEVFPLSIEELSARSDLVVTGQLVRQRSYVSEDGTDVLTDYQIVPHQVVVARTTNAAPVPGQTPPMILTLLGGEVTVNGTPVTMANSAMWALRDRAEFLIFATAKEGGANRFELTGDSAGIFEVERNGLKPLLSSTSRNREIEGVPLESILAKIRESLSR